VIGARIDVIGKTAVATLVIGAAAYDQPRGAAVSTRRSGRPRNAPITATTSCTGSTAYRYVATSTSIRGAGYVCQAVRAGGAIAEPCTTRLPKNSARLLGFIDRPQGLSLRQRHTDGPHAAAALSHVLPAPGRHHRQTLGLPFPGPLCGMGCCSRYLQFSGGPSDQLTAVGTNAGRSPRLCSCRRHRDRDLCGASGQRRRRDPCRPGDLDRRCGLPAVSWRAAPPSIRCGLKHR